MEFMADLGKFLVTAGLVATSFGVVLISVPKLATLGSLSTNLLQNAIVLSYTPLITALVLASVLTLILTLVVHQ